jgi:hypothetical protein
MWLHSSLADLSGLATNQELTNGRTEFISVVIRLCENFVAKAKTSRFDYDFCLRKKIPTIFVRSEFKHDVDGDESTLRITITHEDFAIFDKGKIPIQLCLRNSLMICRIGPIKMVTYSENDMSRLLIRTYHVDEVWLLNGHLSPAGRQAANGF